MFEINFNCDASKADNILLLLLLKATHYGWSLFEVEHDYTLATFMFNSESDNRSVIASIIDKDEEDITVYKTR